MGGPDWTRAAATLAARQHGRVNRRQLLAVGVSDKAVERALAAGRLLADPKFRGVYALGHAARTKEARFMAAVLSCPPDAVLSHTSAAIHFGLLPDRPRDPVHVSSVSGRKRTPARHVHRLRDPLHPRDRCTRNAIPTATIPRLILDIAETATHHDLERALNEAHFSFDLTLDAVNHAARRAPGRHALKPIAALLEHYDDGTNWTRTDFERALKHAVAQTGLPKPSMNHPFGAFEIDAAWPDVKLAVEADGRAAHSTPRTFERDRVKQNDLTLSGWLVLRFTHHQLRNHPDRVTAQIVAAYDGGGLLADAGSGRGGPGVAT
jgi:very-short-patch-repair endonuclease